MNDADHAGEDILRAACALDAAELMPNKSGNVSCRTPGGFLITPSGLPYRELTTAQLVEVAWTPAGPQPRAGGPRPSSEWRLHAAIYDRRPEVAAIVHTHSPRATALACAGQGIPPFHYMIALAGGAVRCMPYETFGTEALAEAAVRGLWRRRAVLLANHGVVAVGASLARASAVALEVENLAGQYLDLLAAGLEPQLLTDGELETVISRFADYGRLDPA
jgi:L-fuculose-phosphate aldolase